MRGLRKNRWFWIAGLAVAVALLAGPVVAAEFQEGDTYRLEAGQVVEDDLYVTAQEIYIDGTVKGDLIAFGGLVEVKGRVEGDVIIGGADVRILGTITDDARIAGAGVEVSGTIGDDLFGAAGGGTYQSMVQFDGRSVVQGLRLRDGASVGGGAYLAAGSAEVGGAIGENLFVGAENVNLAAAVGGDADIDAARISVGSGAAVEGELRYTVNEGRVPDEVAGTVFFEPRPADTATPVSGPSPLAMVGRLLLALLGFALMGWLLLRYAPRTLTRPAEALAARPLQAGAYGLAAAALLIFLPLLSILLVVVAAVFWGWFPAVVLFLFLFAALSLIWVLSPLVTGLWLGRAIVEATGRNLNDFAALMIGVALIAILGLVPVLGWLVGLFSFLFAVGALFLARRGTFDAPAPTFTPAPTPV